MNYAFSSVVIDEKGKGSRIVNKLVDEKGTVGRIQKVVWSIDVDNPWPVVELTVAYVNTDGEVVNRTITANCENSGFQFSLDKPLEELVPMHEKIQKQL